MQGRLNQFEDLVIILKIGLKILIYIEFLKKNAKNA